MNDWLRTGPRSTERCRGGVIVDNASTDRTSEVAQIASSPEPPVRVTRCPTLGKGAAIKHGIGLSTHDVAGFMDADCATDLAALRVASDLWPAAPTSP